MPSPTENQGRDTGTEPVEQKSRKGVEKGYGGEKGRDAPRQPVPGEGVSFWHQLAGAYATSIKEQNEVGRHMQKSLAQAEREFVHETEQLRLESWPSVQDAYVRLLEAKPSDIEGLLRANQAYYDILDHQQAEADRADHPTHERDTHPQHSSPEKPDAAACIPPRHEHYSEESAAAGPEGDRIQ